MASHPPVVLFHYPGSPFSARVLYYLALRDIPYDECIQPNILPRPDLARLGIRYRRIPLLAIGRDVYLDSPLILERLERLTTPSNKHPFKTIATPSQRSLTHLLASYTLDTALFKNIVCVLLPATPLMQDEAFMKDRAEMVGGPPGFNFADFVLPARNDAIVEVKKTLEFLEFTLLADGRQWLAETEDPTLADIEMVWPLHWLFQTPGAIPEEHITTEQFPRVFDWVGRFERAVAEAGKKQDLRRPEMFSGEEVAALLGKAAVEDEVEARVEQGDPLVQAQGFYQGQEVLVWPADTGANHKTKGKLVGLTSREITLDTTEGEVSVRVHAPRHGFRVAAAPEKANLS